MYEIQEDIVLIVKEIKTNTQTAVEKTFHDYFYHTKIEKQEGNVIIKMYNYLDEFQEDYSSEVVVSINGEKFTDYITNGLLELELDIQATGKYIIKTENDNIRNGVLEFEHH